MNCAVKPLVRPIGLVGGVQANPTGAGFTVQAPEQHADGRTFASYAHTVGGVGVRLLCPLTSLLGRVAGVCSPATRFDGGVSA